MTEEEPIQYRAVCEATPPPFLRLRARSSLEASPSGRRGLRGSKGGERPRAGWDEAAAQRPQEQGRVAQALRPLSAGARAFTTRSGQTGSGRTRQRASGSAGHRQRWPESYAFFLEKGRGEAELSRERPLCLRPHSSLERSATPVFLSADREAFLLRRGLVCVTREGGWLPPRRGIRDEVRGRDGPVGRGVTRACWDPPGRGGPPRAPRGCDVDSSASLRE